MATTGEPYGLFWDSQSGDRTYSAASFEYWLKKFFTSGVFNGDMQVNATSGMTLEIEPGYANVDGKVKFWNGAFNLTLNPANSTYPRIDTIVITRDNVNREITCEVVTGSYSADTPQPTAPIRTAEIYQLVLAQIYVGAGVTEITQSSITDTRPDNSLCGWITGTVTQLDFSQFTAQFEAYFAEFKADAEGDYAAWFNNVQQEQIEDKEAWDAWYAALQEELHELPPDSAEYLQVEIDELKESGLSGSIFKITTINSSLEGKSVSITNADGTEVKTGTFDSNLECMIYGMKSVGELTITSTDGIQTATSVISIPYFGNYVVPIAFWAATVNIQGDESLYGATITVKDSDNLTVGTVTLSAIDGTGTFIATKADTYTFNFTYQSVAYSQELVITQETTYSISLSAGFNWQTWVNTARFLDSSDYASLDEVLADEEAVRELCLEHNCVDYFCGISSVDNNVQTIINNDLFAKWVNNSDYALDNMYANEAIADAMDEAGKYGYGEWCLMPQVPTMTSNTVPYGTASASSKLNDTYDAWKAFDNTSSDGWAPSSANNSWLQYQFPQAVIVKKFGISIPWAGGNPQTSQYKISGSNDGSNWTDLGTFTHTTAEGSIEYHDLENSTAYTYYRLSVLAYNSSPYVAQLQFYAYAPKGNVPIMTSNTAPYGEAYSDSVFSGRNAFNVFDHGNLDYVAANNSVGHVLQYKFVNPVNVRRVFLDHFCGTAFTTAVSFKIQASNDGSDWTDLTDAITANTPQDNLRHIQIVEVDNNNYYLYHRVYYTTSIFANNSSFYGVNELQFYGRELSVSVPIMTSNTAPYGEVIGYPATPYGNYVVFDGVNNDAGHCWQITYEANNSYIGYKFINPIKLKRFYLENNAVRGAQSIKGFILQASNTGNANDWVDLGTFTNPSSSNYTRTYFDVDITELYKYFRIFVTSKYSTDQYVGIGKLQFYGLDYTEREFETGTTKKWLYDHGLELVDFGSPIVSGSAIAEKQATQFYGQVVTGGQNSFAFAPTDAIDLTDYDLLMARAGDRFTVGNSAFTPFQIGVKAARTYSYSDGTMLGVSQKGLPLTDLVLGLDISSINQSAYPMYADSTSGAERSGTIKEIWLE